MLSALTLRTAKAGTRLRSRYLARLGAIVSMPRKNLLGRQFVGSEGEIAQGAIDGASVLSNSSLDTGQASVRPLELRSKVIVV